MEQKTQIIKSPDFTKVLTAKHKNKWVVLSSNYKKILAVGDTLDEVKGAVSDRNTVVMNTYPLFMSYAPLISPTK